MTIQLINIGTSANDGTGDSPRARCIKINNMFQELYSYFSSNTKKRFLATPTAADGVPTFREIVEDDLPSISASKISDLPTGLTLSQVYPVGSIYMSTTSTNPSTLFGFGTWERFANGRCIVGVDEGQGEFVSPLTTGGAKTHALTANQNGQHAHTTQGYVINVGGGGVGYFDSGDYTLSISSGTNNSGGGEPHNNLQPYICVYIFRRTA